MHVVIANRWYPPHTGYGGVAMYNQTLARGLIQSGHAVSIIAAKYSSAVPELEMDGAVEVHRLDYPVYRLLHHRPIIRHYIRTIEHALYSRKVAEKIDLIAAEQPVDLVEFAEINAEGFAYLRRAKRRPVVIRCHTPSFLLAQYHRSEEMAYDLRFISAMERFCIRKAELVTAPSKDLAVRIETLCGFSEGTVRPVPNPVRTDAFTPSAEQKSDRQGFTILHVGRLDRVKGIDVILQAIPAVLSGCSRARFVFVGAGRSDQETQAWRERILDAGQNRVTFLGFLEPDELIRTYLDSDVAVIPSLNYESFSYTCAQAMAAGVPVIATSIGGMPETVGEGGLIIPPNDPADLASALLQLANDPVLSRDLGRTARTRARTFFDQEVVAEKMSALYESLHSRVVRN